MPVIFDMDGVLVDSEVHWKKVEGNFLRGLVPYWDETLQHSIIGMSAYDVHRYLSREHGVTLTHEEFVGYYRGLAGEIYGAQSTLLPGAREVLEDLSSRKIRLALCSSSPHDWIDIVLSRFELRDHFELVVSSDDVQARGKPHPDIYLAVASGLQVPASHCIAIEDSGKGVQSAVGAGMSCVGLRNGFNDHQDLSAAALIVEGLEQLSFEQLKSICPLL